MRGHSTAWPLLTQETISSDAALANYIRATVGTQFIAAVPRGCATGAMALVNRHCRLRTIPNLRVVDASVMPTIPRANINLTCIMIADHVCVWIRDDS